MITTLLVADADGNLLDLYRYCFVDRGYRVETASTGLDCLEKLRLFLPDLLILDWGLPWGGGDGVLSHMRQDMHLPRIPVIVTMPPMTRETPDELIVPPVIACLRKPFRTRNLVEEVQSLESLGLEREHS